MSARAATRLVGDALVRWVAPLGLFGFCVAVRVASWPAIVRADGIHLPGNDPYYHMHRIQHAVQNFPRILSFDPEINFPDGGQAIWSPSFDWLLAAVARLFVGVDDPAAVERLVIWAPPVLAGLTTVFLYRLARRLFPTWVAVIAGLMFCVLPAHFEYSELGFVDHHVAVALAGIWMLDRALRLVEATASQAHTASHARRETLALGLAMGVSLLVWPGSLLQVGIVQLGLLVHLLAFTERGVAIARAERLAWVHGVACVVVLPLCLDNEWIRWGRASPLVLSEFQPLFLGASALALVLLAVVWRVGQERRGAVWRAGTAVALGAFGATAAFATLPELREGVSNAWSWLFASEEFQAAVLESRPLLWNEHGQLDWGESDRSLGFFVRLAPLGIAGLVLGGVRRRPDRALLLWWIAAHLLATLVQRRFANSYAPAHALLIGWVLFVVYAAAVARLPARTALRAAVATALGAVTLASLAPTAIKIVHKLGNLERWLAGEPVQLGRYQLREAALTDLGRWLRERPSPHAPADDAVLSAWGDGHILQYRSGRPVVQNNFGDDVGAANFAVADEYFAAVDEEQALRLLERLRVRYVLARSVGSGHHGGPYPPHSMLSRLFFLRGGSGQASLDPRDGRAISIASLGRHRLLYQTNPVPIPGMEQSGYKLFEHVPGARVVGTAEPGGIVVAQLDVTPNHGAPFAYVRATRADAEGRYELTLPYPTEAFSSAVRVGDHYWLSSGKRAEQVQVRERAVLEGARIEGPSFRP